MDHLLTRLASLWGDAPLELGPEPQDTDPDAREATLRQAAAEAAAVHMAAAMMSIAVVFDYADLAAAAGCEPLVQDHAPGLLVPNPDAPRIIT